MIVTITSWAPTVALSSPAMPAHSAPASAPSTSARTMWTTPGRPSRDEPIQTPTNDPIRYWPFPPMLKRPQRNANATARPVRISVVVRTSVVWRLNAAVVRSLPVTQGNSQLSPVPLKISRYVESGFFPVVTTITRPPRRNATSVVMSAVASPPACWSARSRPAAPCPSGSPSGAGAASLTRRPPRQCRRASRDPGPARPRRAGTRRRPVPRTSRGCGPTATGSRRARGR